MSNHARWALTKRPGLNSPDFVLRRRVTDMATRRILTIRGCQVDFDRFSPWRQQTGSGILSGAQCGRRIFLFDFACQRLEQLGTVCCQDGGSKLDVHILRRTCGFPID